MARSTQYRWIVCALLFPATTINCVDRNSLSVLKTIIEQQLGWTLICWFCLGNKFETADVDTLPDVSRVSRPLLGGGVALTLLGAVFAVVIASHWETCVKAATLAGAAQAATAAVGVAVIGATLAYAGLPKKNGA